MAQPTNLDAEADACMRAAPGVGRCGLPPRPQLRPFPLMTRPPFLRVARRSALLRVALLLLVQFVLELCIHPRIL